MAETLIANLRTNHGTIRIKLFPDKAPNTVRNFVELAEGTREWRHPATGERMTTPLYNGTIFHRVIDGFMIQGGDPIGRGPAAPGTCSTTRSTTRTGSTGRTWSPWRTPGSGAGRGTNGSQFFITVAPQPHLDRNHTIFGEVIEGTEVVDSIARTPTDHRDRPLQDAVIEEVTIERS